MWLYRTKKGEGNLESKVNNNLFPDYKNLVRVDKTMPYSERQLARFWEELRKNGKIYSIGSMSKTKFNDNDKDIKIEGSASYSMNSYGTVPEDVAMLIGINDEKSQIKRYFVGIEAPKLGKNSAHITVISSLDNMAYIDELFETIKQDEVNVKLEYSNDEIRHFYEFINDKSDMVRVVEDPYNKAVFKKSGSSYYQVSGRFSAKINNRDYVFTIKQPYGKLPGRDYEITVEVSNEQKDELLKIIDEFQEKYNISIGGDSEVTGTRKINNNINDLNVDDDNVKSSISSNDKKKSDNLAELVDKEVLSAYDWDSLGGLSEVKENLKEFVCNPLKNVDVYGKRLGITVPSGIILWGPPGNGKTSLAYIIANVTDSPLYVITFKQIVSKYHGESEKNLGALFDVLKSETKKSGRVVALINELDGVFSNEANEYTRELIAQFKSEWDHLNDNSRILIIGTTNKINRVEPGLIRPGRFTKIIEVPNPNKDDRKDIFRLYLNDNQLKKTDIDKIVDESNGFSGADIKEVVNSAKNHAVSDYLKKNNLDASELKPNDILKINFSIKYYEKAIKDIRKQKSAMKKNSENTNENLFKQFIEIFNKREKRTP